MSFKTEKFNVIDLFYFIIYKKYLKNKYLKKFLTNLNLIEKNKIKKRNRTNFKDKCQLFFPIKTKRFNEIGSHQPLSFVTRLSLRLKQKCRNYLSEIKSSNDESSSMNSRVKANIRGQTVQTLSDQFSWSNRNCDVPSMFRKIENPKKSLAKTRLKRILKWIDENDLHMIKWENMKINLN